MRDETPGGPAARDTSIERHPAVERELARLLDVNGVGILDQSSQLRRSLLAAAPDSERHVALLLAALAAGVGKRLQAVEDGDERIQNVFKTCVEEMKRNGVDDLGQAWWAVRTWAHAFALPTFDNPPLPGGTPPPRPAPASPQPAPRTEPAAAPRAEASPPTWTGEVFRRRTAPSGAAPPRDPPAPPPAARADDSGFSPSAFVPLAPPAEDPPAPATRARFPDWPTDPAPAAGETSTELPQETVEPDAGDPHDWPQTVLQAPAGADSAAIASASHEPASTAPGPIAPVSNGASVARSAAPEPSSTTHDRQEPAFGGFATPAPTVAAHEPSLDIEPLFGDVDLAAPTLRGTPEPAFVASPAVATSGFTARDEAPPLGVGLRADEREWHPRGSRDRSWMPIVVVLVFGIAIAALIAVFVIHSFKLSSDPRPDFAATTAAPPSTASTSPAPEPSASTAPSSAPVASSPPSPVESDRPTQPSPTAPTPAPVTESPAVGAPATTVEAPPVATAPSPAVTTSPPASAPATSSAARAVPTIARIDVPTVVEGAPFSIAIEVPGGARDVATIERRFRDATGAWPRSANSLAAVGLQRTGDTFYVPFRAMDAPARATIDFTVVTRDGRRSAARSATIVLADPYPASVRAAASAALEGVTAACTASTCGHVVSVRDVQADSRSQSRLYEVTVLMDDKEQYVFTATYHPAEGARMRMSNGTFTRVTP